MYTRCLVCATPFEVNEELANLPHGTRLAFDPARGRLSAVCRSRRMFWAGALQVVRVREAKLTKDAWRRYGRALTTRKRKWGKLAVAGTVAAGAVVAGGRATGGMSMLGVLLVLGHGSETLRDGARWLRFGGSAWRGEERCAKCGYRFYTLSYREGASSALLFPTEEPGKVELVARCPQCGESRDAGLRLRGQEADRTLRHVLAYQHFAGASEHRVVAAARLIQEAGPPVDLTWIVVKEGRRLGDRQRTGGIALEIAANEASEQRLLKLELAELEAHWRREEELASIIDGELTPLPMLEGVRRVVTNKSGQ